MEKRILYNKRSFPVLCKAAFKAVPSVLVRTVLMTGMAKIA